MLVCTPLGYHNRDVRGDNRGATNLPALEEDCISIAGWLLSSAMKEEQQDEDAHHEDDEGSDDDDGGGSPLQKKAKAVTDGS